MLMCTLVLTAHKFIGSLIISDAFLKAFSLRVLSIDEIFWIYEYKSSSM